MLMQISKENVVPTPTSAIILMRKLFIKRYAMLIITIPEALSMGWIYAKCHKSIISFTPTTTS